MGVCFLLRDFGGRLTARVIPSLGSSGKMVESFTDTPTHTCLERFHMHITCFFSSLCR